MKSPPRTAETHGAFLAGEASASPAIFDIGGIQTCRYTRRERWPCGQEKSFCIGQAIFIPVSNHVDNIPTSDLVNK